MRLIDYIALCVLATAVVFAVVWIVRRKKRGIDGCGGCGGCDGCPHKGTCNSR